MVCCRTVLSSFSTLADGAIAFFRPWLVWKVLPFDVQLWPLVLEPLVSPFLGGGSAVSLTCVKFHFVTLEADF